MKTKHFSRMFAVLSAAVLTLGANPLPASAAVTLLPGDVNGDGSVTWADAVVMQGWLFGHDNIEVYAPENTDVNGDGFVNAIDLTLIKQTVLAGGTAPQPQLTDGKLYRQIALTDPKSGVVAFEGVLPDGWTAELDSYWGNINPAPGQAYVTIYSPDKSAQIFINSMQVYQYESDLGYGTDLSNYITREPYMNASQYVDYIVQSSVQNGLFSNASLIKEIETPAEQQEALTAAAKSYYESGAATLQQIMQYPYEMQGYEGTASRKQYQIGDSYAEFSTAIRAYQFAYRKITLDITMIWWDALNTVTYAAVNKETFDQYYDDYETIIANGCFSAAFYSLNSYVNQRIMAMMLEARTELAAEQAAADYTGSGTQVTNSDMETQERVMQAWDDYIKDDNAYSLSDGSTLRVPTSVDTVAQNGSDLYFGTAGGVPEGYNILVPQAIG